MLVGGGGGQVYDDGTEGPRWPVSWNWRSWLKKYR